MRGFFAFIAWLIMAAIVAALAIFAVQNAGSATTHLLGWTFSIQIWWIAIGAAILGFVLAFLLVAPGSVAARWRSRGLQRERMRLEQQMAQMHAERDQLGESHEQLRAEHRTVVAERDRLRAQQAAATVATPTTQAPATAAVDSTPATSQPGVTPRQPLQATPASADGGYVTQAQAQPQQTNGATTTVPPEEQPGLGERVRAVFRRPTPEQQTTEQEQYDQYPQGPTAPSS